MKIAARASLVVAGVIASLAGSARYTRYSADYNVEKPYTRAVARLLTCSCP